MEPFLGEVRIFSWSWAPTGWALCDGSILPVSQNQALAALLGNQFGGDGKTTFQLPDLRGRTPINLGVGQDGQQYIGAQVGGLEAVPLTVSNLPQHSHEINALSKPGNATGAKSALPASVGKGSSAAMIDIYSQVGSGPTTALAGDTLTTEGGGAPHNNMQPFIVMNFCIATSGLWPPQQ